MIKFKNKMIFYPNMVNPINPLELYLDSVRQAYEAVPDKDKDTFLKHLGDIVSNRALMASIMAAGGLTALLAKERASASRSIVDGRSGYSKEPGMLYERKRGNE
jgi:hypothetical protein